MAISPPSPRTSPMKLAIAPALPCRFRNGGDFRAGIEIFAAGCGSRSSARHRRKERDFVARMPTALKSVCC